MDVTATMDAPCAPEGLFEWVADLARYPSWLTIVERAELVPDSVGTASRVAWTVDLRGRLGPFARSKRLRMVRTELEPARLAAFERRETDARGHARWALRAEIEPLAGSRSALTMRLHYGGPFWGPVLERLLADEIEASRRRLLALVSAQTL